MNSIGEVLKVMKKICRNILNNTCHIWDEPKKNCLHAVNHKKLVSCNKEEFAPWEGCEDCIPIWKFYYLKFWRWLTNSF